jgi:hypothetical protein
MKGSTGVIGKIISTLNLSKLLSVCSGIISLDIEANSGNFQGRRIMNMRFGGLTAVKWYRLYSPGL